MDAINKFVAQLADLFRSLTPGARLVAGLLLVVVVVSVAYLFNSGITTGDAFLFGGEPVSPSQLPAMEAAFSQAGLMDYEVEGNRIRVKRGKQAAYMGALADAGALPHNFGDTIKRMIDGSNPFISKKQQEERLKFALQDELAKIISKMRGIEAASVLYDTQTQAGFGAKKLISASVSVKPQGSQSLTPDQVQMIRHVVAGAIAGLSPESVAVADLNGRVYPAGVAGGSSGDVSQDRYVNTKLKYEQEYSEKIREALLSFVSGAVVTVNVELNPELEASESSTKVDPKAVAIDISETTNTSNTSTPQLGGRPGLASQGGVNQPAVINSAAAGGRSETEQSQRHERSLVSHDTKQVRKAGLTPSQVKVSVGIPSSYFEQVWRQRNPTVAGQEPPKPDGTALAQIEQVELKKIQDYVLQVVPVLQTPGSNPLPLVAVTSFQHVPVAAIPTPSMADKAVLWFGDHGGTLGMVALGVVALLMVRSVLRSIPAPAASLPASEMKLSAMENEANSELSEIAPKEKEPSTARLRRRSKSGPSLRDELVDIVREDPDAAANILRNWIAAGGQS